MSYWKRLVEWCQEQSKIKIRTYNPRNVAVLATISIIIASSITLGAWRYYFPPIGPVKAKYQDSTIYIRADGSVDPPTAPISTDDNVTYTFTDNIYGTFVVERSHITIDGAGYTLRARNPSLNPNLTYQGPSAGESFNGFTVDGSYDVTIHHVNIEDSSFWPESSILPSNERAILLNNTSHNTIFANTITNNLSYGILVINSSNNRIFGNTITNNERGISLYFSSNNTLRNNDVSNNKYGIRFYDSSDNTLRNHDVSNNEYNFAVEGSEVSHYIQDIDDSNTVDGKPIYIWVNKRDMTIPLDAGYVALANCTNIIVENLNLANNRHGVQLAFTTNSTIINNNITNNARGIVLRSKSSNNIINGNNITANNYNGIGLYNSSNNSIFGNNITNNGADGISITESSNNIINGNNITNNYCGISSGISSGRSSNNTISGNTITNNDYHGIRFFDSSNNTISGNTITNNGCGIELGGSNNNTIAGNTVSNNGQYGIFIDGSSNNILSGNNVSNSNYGIGLFSSGHLWWAGNTVSSDNVLVGNTVSNNGDGISLGDSSDNTLFHNNFINNTNQVISENSTNTWDDGYPSGGNYWSDYEERYPSATEIDGSGIWDTPYIIDENNQDNYPIVPEFPT